MLVGYPPPVRSLLKLKVPSFMVSRFAALQRVMWVKDLLIKIKKVIVSS